VTTSDHDFVMVGEGRPSMSFLATIGKAVDTDRSLSSGGLWPDPGVGMTGKVKPETRQ
jgi:hypothetical protein